MRDQRIIANAEDDGLVSRRAFFVIMAVLLLLITTNRFDGDVWAFSYAVLVLGGVMYLE